MYTIVTTGNSVLTQPSEEVKKFDKKLLNIIEEMKVTLNNTKDPVGVGLAAPQVGIPLRIFLAKPLQKSKISVFINPVIVENQITANPLESDEKSVKIKRTRKRLLEGCLSIPNIWGNVTRKKQITISYQDEKGNSHTKTFKGFIATIVQHELDHLSGLLFTKHVIEQNEKLYRSYKNEKGEDEFEEINL